MSWADLKPELISIREFSRTVHKVNNDNSALFAFINNIPAKAKHELHERFLEGGDGPIMSIRKMVGNQILNGPVNANQIEKEFSTGKKRDPKSFTPYKNLFAVLYPFVLHSTIDHVYATLQATAELIRHDLGLDVIADIKVYGFDGARNSGDEHAWFAIYNNSHPNQKTAKQLFFSIRDGKATCTLYDRVTDKHTHVIELNLDTDGYDKVVKFYTEHKEKVVSDNFRARVLEKYSIDSLISKLESKAIRSWLIKPGEKGSMWKAALEEGNIRIGWTRVIDEILRSNNYSDDFVLERLTHHYPREDENRRQTNNKLSIVSFLKEGKIGDLVLSVLGISQIIGIGVITSDASQDEEDVSTGPFVRWTGS